ncbi:hypothetical protein PAMP_017418 [Pampus punctatissimus]
MCLLYLLRTTGTSTSFTSTPQFIDGQVYDGVVKALEEARKQYTKAVSLGQSAGLVSSVGRTLEEFKTSVTVAAHKKVTFELTYEELLRRTLGKYELQIHARPMQPVKDFKVDVYIHEKTNISFTEVKGGLNTKALANAITKTHTGKQVWVHFYPTEDQQKTCDSCGEQGMNGDLIIVYDVQRDASLGDIQTRTALIRILTDLAEDDYFGLITFDSRISHWKRELVQASKRHLDSAKDFAQKIFSGGWMTNLEQIQSNVREAIAGNFPLYCLGFGFDVNFEFLEKMSLRNNGAARRIYEDSDADLQLGRNQSVTFYDTKANVESTGTVSDSHIQRIWAYLTVKQLLMKDGECN